jgi:hypothetical protein
LWRRSWRDRSSPDLFQHPTCFFIVRAQAQYLFQRPSLLIVTADRICQQPPGVGVVRLGTHDLDED